MRVEVYKNLHKNCWSVRDKKSKKVILHAVDLYLTDCVFKVSSQGRARVLRDKAKNVHAWVEGTLHKPTSFTEPRLEITYNPYIHSSFVVVNTGEKVDRIDAVYLGSNGKVYSKGE